MTYKLCEYHLQKIAQLPLWIQQLKEQYPLAVYNTSDAYYLAPFPFEYRPEEIEIYYGDDYEDLDVCIEGTELTDFNEKIPPDISVIQLRIDGDWAYIQVEGMVILDRLYGVILPEIVLDHEVLLHSILRFKQSKI